MKFIDLFSGIGGFRTGMEMNGHECVAFCEIDKYARQSYKAIYDTEGEEEWHDITQVSNDDFRAYRGRTDVITGGFPCQAFSIAGKRRGFEDTRGTLFFDIARAIKEIQPSYALLENVKGLFSHDKGRTFGTIIQALDELGYVVEWGLFNSKYWGVPQNRERVFILATRKDIFRQPKLIELLNRQTEVNTKLIDVLESEVDEKYFLSDERVEQLKFNDKVQKGDIKQVAQYDTDKRENSNRFRTYDIEGIGPGLSTMGGGGLEPCITVLGNTAKTGHKSQDIHDANGISPTIAARDYKGAKQIAVPVLTPDRVNKRQNGRRFKEDGEPMFTLTAQDRHGIAIRETTEEQAVVLGIGHHPLSKKREFNGYRDLSPTLIATDYKAPKTVLMSDFRIRKLTPLECWRLQGFTDEQFYKAKNDGVSNSQLYKQAGNSVTVNVIDAIARKLV